MINSLFEIYDPYTFFLSLSLNWVSVGFALVFSFSEIWCFNSFISLVLILILNFIIGEFSNFYNIKKVASGILLFVSLFFFLINVNILGLVPYVFSCSSHFLFSTSLSVPIWMGFMILGWLKFSNFMFMHLIPVGTPLGLISFMVVIETVSNFIRPWSLSIRLMSNMISGHLLMCLLGDCSVFFFIIQSFLFLFEFFVCFIQSFVFSALLTLYSSEIFYF